MEVTQHILVIDDDADIRLLLAGYLRKNGFRVTTAPDGPAMRKLLANGHFDLLVLDVMLPGEDGLALCQWVRGGLDTPIIMLTALHRADDRITGLEAGADDYLTKPFTPKELLVRIRNVLRRTTQGRSQGAIRQFHFGRWSLDIVSRNLTDAGGVVIPLGSAEYRVLSKLLAARQKVLARAELMDLGPDKEPSPMDRSVDICISRLRQVLGEDAREPTIIKTVHGQGYLIGVDVRTS